MILYNYRVFTFRSVGNKIKTTIDIIWDNKFKYAQGKLYDSYDAFITEYLYAPLSTVSFFDNLLDGDENVENFILNTITEAVDYIQLNNL